MENKVLLGVCEKLGKSFGVDPLLFRIIFIICGFSNFWTTLIVYFILAIFMN